MLKRLLLSASISVALSTTGTASAQNTMGGETSPQPLEIFSPAGFDLDEVHQFALRIGYSGSIQTTEDGFRYSALIASNGIKFIVVPEFCQPQIGCVGLHFLSYHTPASQMPLTSDSINAFNVARPHGNLSFVASEDAVKLQRAITNISGITYGSLAGEFGVFTGYSMGLMEFLAAQEMTTNVKLDQRPAESSQKPLTVSARNATPAYNIGSMSLSADDLFNSIMEQESDRAINFLTVE